MGNIIFKNLGYGLNLDTCVVSGSSENIYFISPKSGNAVSFKIGKKYEKKNYSKYQSVLKKLIMRLTLKTVSKD